MSNNIINWFEIPVTNMDKAAAFYGKVLRTELRREVFFGIPNAVFPTENGEATKGSLIADPKRPPRTGGGTCIYLHAADGVGQALARAYDAGAKVVQPETSIGPFGTIAAFEDLDGNIVGLHTPAA
jgi:predicted enzyme related to lactoylglutathione lyase